MLFEAVQSLFVFCFWLHFVNAQTLGWRLNILVKPRRSRQHNTSFWLTISWCGKYFSAVNRWSARNCRRSKRNGTNARRLLCYGPCNPAMWKEPCILVVATWASNCRSPAVSCFDILLSQRLCAFDNVDTYEPVGEVLRTSELHPLWRERCWVLLTWCISSDIAIASFSSGQF